MAVSQRLDLRQAQSLVMTPQLQQAIKLLQLSQVELTAFVDQELEGNPLLERDEAPVDGSAVDPPQPEPEPEAESSLAAEVREQWADAAGSEGEGNLDLAGDPAAWQSTQARRSADEDFPGLDQTLTRAQTLRDHLTDQIRIDLSAPADRLIAHHLLDLVDEAGYVQGSLEDVAERLGTEPPEVERVLLRLQHMDPPGVFARNLAECLALQLRERNRLDPAMQALLDHLPLLASRNLAELVQVCGVDAEDIHDMAAEIRSLDPKPGLAFDPATADSVIPDVLMRSDGEGGWIVELNTEALPRVLVNNAYYAQVSRGTRGKPDREYLSERFQAANWLVKALHQRATTILKVSREIVRQQDGFFRHGIQHLRPLVLRDIAGAIAMHESTVSRVTSNKFMATPRGMFELKYFFTSSIAATNGSAALSAETVRFRIKALIDSERSDGVLSDDQIVDILIKDGVDIARRTVAKYREAMRIPSSVQRRREKAQRI
ncbi:MAG TPA: RNA polymerase factor sigma-54 [Stellaceae bacterium]|jgi:RNA polymerase sigma-54 factor|nr:RNA polymerase factor sigma-54 [Stellaceae bacterium]